MLIINKFPTLSLGEALKQAFSKLTVFKGRARRSEFWWCFLVASVVCALTSWIPYMGALVCLLVAIAMIPLTVRRLHDCDHSGWWLAYSVILFAVGFIVFILCAFSFSASWAGIFAESSIRKYYFELYSNPFYKLLAIVFALYAIATIIMLCRNGLKGPNKYGESPKYEIYEVEDDE